MLWQPFRAVHEAAARQRVPDDLKATAMAVVHRRSGKQGPAADDDDRQDHGDVAQGDQGAAVGIGFVQRQRAPRKSDPSRPDRSDRTMTYAVQTE